MIDLLGRLHGGHDPVRRDELAERFELDPRKRCPAYSTGNRQKVALVAALASDAELLVLDEPTSGIDPLMEAAFGAEIARERGRGRTVLPSSHILSGAGEVTGSGPAWWSPIGWARYVRAFADERWWVLGPFATLAAARAGRPAALLAVTVIAVGLAGIGVPGLRRRDLG